MKRKIIINLTLLVLSVLLLVPFMGWEGSIKVNVISLAILVPIGIVIIVGAFIVGIAIGFLRQDRTENP